MVLGDLLYVSLATPTKTGYVVTVLLIVDSKEGKPRGQPGVGSHSHDLRTGDAGIPTRRGDNALSTGIASMVFMAGWICSNVGMQRMRATGTGTWGRTVLLIQLVGLVLAFIFDSIEATALLDENNIVFVVTDLAWPLSMLWMLVVGVTAIRAKRLSGWQRFVPVLCPFWLPLVALGGAAFGEAGGVIGLGYSAVLKTPSQKPSPSFYDYGR